MSRKLHYNTVAPALYECLNILMKADAFKSFRLVGGTALSLYRGHRLSIDIDLFTDARYGSVDFESIHSFLRETYPYADTNDYTVTGMGKSYYVGQHKNNCVKLDLFYTDDFISDAEVIDNIRLATIEDIIAMKVDVVLRGGRKKDFWDLHELMADYPIEKMLALHEQRYPYNHNRDLIKTNFIDFESANADFDPVCLKNKHWEIIKLDLIDFGGRLT